MHENVTCTLSWTRTSVRTDFDVLTFDTKMDTNVSAVLKTRAGQRGLVTWSPGHLVTRDLPRLVSPGPACVHLDDLGVPRFGPQEPGTASILQRAPVIWASVVEAVVAMETLHAADMEQLIILRFIWEVKGPQSCLLQDNSGGALLNII